MGKESSDFIIISVTKLRILGITPNQFVLLVKVARGLKDPSQEDHKDIEALILKGYLIENSHELKLTEKVRAFDLDLEQAWTEFKNTYPSRTPDNSRNLRSGLSVAKDKYCKYLRSNTAIHEDIIKSLQREIQHRKQTNTLKFMPAVSTYVNQKLWEDYLDSDEQLDTSTNLVGSLIIDTDD
ncbi:MAG: hypothetical protein HC836_39120 [Richelia sp. RM2_1_2]|nr:hypothetical protein [Richelia sp. RM2_1_2]